jgi:hypothetical protein
VLTRVIEVCSNLDGGMQDYWPSALRLIEMPSYYSALWAVWLGHGSCL